ncbi:MAG: hypothetical protein DRN61_04535 [Thaumarchaeota archaeon]|nr:MAG: hypothetical protein DRN61_04535 [Nitrososphaerota archaeon]RLJ00673.1 MAG: hypothetical protein DRP08_06365 [Candidatus Aenigmarchaeota archaeon]
MGYGEKKVRAYYGSLLSNRVEYRWVTLGMYGDCSLSAPREVYVDETYGVSLDYANTSFRFLEGKLYVKHSDGSEEVLWRGRIYPKSAVTQRVEVVADGIGTERIKFDVKPLLFGNWTTECSKIVKVKEKPTPPTPPEKTKVVVFANDIDWELCKDDLQECLGDEYELVWTQGKSEYEKYDRRIILGGPKAKVVGDEVQRICDEIEKCAKEDYCDKLCKKEYTRVFMVCPSSGGKYDCWGDDYPVVIVFMGHNRCYTEHVVREKCNSAKRFLEDPEAHVTAYTNTIDECEK